MQVSGAQSTVAQEQLTVAQPEGRGWHRKVAAQGAMHPGCPPSGQGVSLVPAGHWPLAGTGVHARVVQFWWLTHSCPVVQAAASPHGPALSFAASPGPASAVSDDDLQPATRTSASSARGSDRCGTVKNANTPP